MLTPEEEDYLDATERLGYLPMFLLALTAELRQGELSALKWSKLGIKKRTLTITEKRSVERRELVEYESGTRIISLTEEAVELLCLEHGKHPGSPLTFTHPATQRAYSSQMVRLLHNEIIKRGRAGSHSVRRSTAHLRSPVPVKWDGHKRGFSDTGHFRTVMTRHNYAPYLARQVAKDENKPTEASQEELRQAADILNNRLKF